MRLLIAFLVAGALASAAYATDIYTASSEVQALTRVSPRLDAPTESEKISLRGVKEISVAVCTCTSSTCGPGAYPDPGPNGGSPNGFLTGGVLDIWKQHQDAGYIENPDLRLTIGVVDGGCRTWSHIQAPGGNNKGSIFAAARGVTMTYTDAGNYVKVFMEGITNE